MERYRDIIDDWQAFQEACESPALSAVRRNRLKACDDFESRLHREFDDVEQSAWNQEVYRLRDEKRPGKSMMHWRGEYYVQEESAAIPVNALDPQPGDAVLDMCAAPGGKSTQMAAKMDNRGKVMANDASAKRMKSLHANVYRTGAACVAATNYDGRHLPEDESYDRVLVDAPCSGEGDRARRDFEPADRDEIESLSRLQKQLVEKAAVLVEEGGTLVYSTCTIAPEENEEVVEHALENTGLKLEHVELDGPHQRGVDGFRGEEYGGEMEKTLRVYAHHMESGVIFVARFSK
ncbi:MAG: RsmB/NOP family class I SAM-dependent RNA methyltransferase [Candidatus Nanohaloarchaea archaeon]